MKRLIGTVAILALFAAGPTLAASPETGWNAYLAGDYAKAYAELKPLADSGRPAAQYYLGVMYAHGMGVTRDENMAATLYRKAAEKGHGPAQFNLGFLLHQRGDYEAAAKWLAQAASSNTTAQALLGEMYLTGRGVFQDDEIAFRYLSEAADGGDLNARFLRAGMYAAGRGTERDLVEAYAWLSVLSFRGYPGAATRLEEVKAWLSEDDMYAADARAGALEHDPTR